MSETKKLTPTPHNKAVSGEIAQTVLMPGDPLRAKFIAETFLTGPVCYNTVRGMLGYTGTYKGRRLSVQGSGMGCPSIGIYSYELFHFYGVDNIIRIGSAGGLADKVQLRDIVIGMGSCTDSNYARQYQLPGTFAPIADYGMLSTAVEMSKKQGCRFMVGNVLSSDVFYSANATASERWLSMRVLCAEMECAALYMNAAYLGKKALGLLTISDLIGDPNRAMTAEERQTKFRDMMTIALETAIAE